MLEGAYCFYRANRYNLKSKELMKTNGKFYIVDLGLRNMLKGSAGGDYGASLENIVYMELIRRGHTVSVGKRDEFEIDFAAEKSGETAYFQVSATMMIPEVRERELRPLLAVRDNYPKTILSLDNVGPGKNAYENIGGIMHRNIVDWVLEG